MSRYSRIRAWAEWSFRPSPSAFLCGALLAPMGVAFEIPADSVSTDSTRASRFERVTRLTFGGGSGTYGRTIHGSRTLFFGTECLGIPINTTQTVNANFRFKDSFDDRGGELDIQATSSLHVGLRGGRIDETVTFLGSDLDPSVIDTLFANVRAPDSTFAYYYFNPFFSIEKERMGWGLGFVYSSNRLWTDEVRELSDFDDATLYPTGHLRLGRLDQAYMKFALWEGVPIYSGGGKFVVGVGVRPARWMELFGGYASGGPFTNGALLVRGNLDVGRHLTAGVNVRVSKDVDQVYYPRFSESAASVFLTYKLISH